ncbi:hypothetical protein CHARACLAT_029718 [Characodon lateralis]|uniref:WSC domain-containing protein n=1 Tax=Characodon lateralis TaxID=208331 RepID=A0ABU7DNB4_9TELE|nr:hypothetical protein [Characodon lateralis]
MLYDLRKMTSSLCQDTCSESGYQFAGLEYGAECHCGNRISSPQAPEEDCSLVCRGERGSPCGGVGRLSIYKVEEQLPGHRKCEPTHLRQPLKEHDTLLFIQTRKTNNRTISILKPREKKQNRDSSCCNENICRIFGLKNSISFKFLSHALCNMFLYFSIQLYSFCFLFAHFIAAAYQ